MKKGVREVFRGDSSFFAGELLEYLESVQAGYLILEVKTMRLWLVIMAGKLVERSRQLTLKLPEKFLHNEEWKKWERMSLEVVFP
ncbi:hypothetical protein KSMBR1_3972 [Candidatus Kuenenia stuttgartiensis]|jgi:hypothetical protein|nr:hypothetical protein KSMBR1_3972 [Candidatus Kuenenia stuttgartiensis]